MSRGSQNRSAPSPLPPALDYLIRRDSVGQLCDDSPLLLLSHCVIDKIADPSARGEDLRRENKTDIDNRASTRCATGCARVNKRRVSSVREKREEEICYVGDCVNVIFIFVREWRRFIEARCLLIFKSIERILSKNFDSVRSFGVGRSRNEAETPLRNEKRREEEDGIGRKRWGDRSRRCRSTLSSRRIYCCIAGRIYKRARKFEKGGRGKGKGKFNDNN